jgi:DNA-binding Xre family transcriptional regulator
MKATHLLLTIINLKVNYSMDTTIQEREEEMNTEKWFKDKLEAFREDAEFYAEELILDLTEQVVVAMKELGVNRTELAARMGVSKAFITKLLRGNTNITLRTMASLARSLGCNVNINVCPKDVELAAKSPTLHASKPCRFT